MRNDLMNFIVTNKKSILLAALIISVIIYIIAISTYTNGIQKKNQKLKAQLEEISSLGAGLIEIKQLVETKEKKIGTGVHKGVITTLDDILNRLNLKAGKLRPSDKKRVAEYIEENAELEIKKIDINEVVNLLHMIESSREPLKVRSIDIQTTFEDRNIFSLSLSVSLLSRSR